jgi:hypothetical protein
MAAHGGGDAPSCDGLCVRHCQGVVIDVNNNIKGNGCAGLGQFTVTCPVINLGTKLLNPDHFWQDIFRRQVKRFCYQ